ncbi:virulence factor Mce family protein [Mycolicibacterium rhodesiae NBB3]|uniref:Virulence factor Mce family protein n=1 Tax=Mycolicibacterium rhodesiae (strain NBB3) TaxID=710685 RepID=G8RPZ8_MYCRN|nr:MlaD family protein [Mycolicibacterium rhodesiae]AEV73882.1 virulence factor Mce family protein [Mycolicibacterium rhodesiae NBB3]
MLTRFIRIQLVVFTILTVVSLVVLGWYYLRIPTLLGFGQYTLHAELPASGGLYPTANVTYRGTTIGRVTAVQTTRTGVLATMEIADNYRIPADASANVHSVSAVGEQYLDLVSATGSAQFLGDGQTITDTTVPAEIGPALDATQAMLSALPKEKIDSLLTETSTAVGGLGPALQRLVDATQSVAGDFHANIDDLNAIIDRSAPIIDSQVDSGDNIALWASDLRTLAAQSAEHDAALRGILNQAAPTVDLANSQLNQVRDPLPQTLANVEIVLDMLKRYNKGTEQGLVALQQGSAIAQTVAAPFPGAGALDFSLSINQPPPCMTGFLPASEWRAPADTSTAPLPENTYCKIPMDTPANVVRGARNYPCVDVPGKRAATPQECRSDKPYIPLGTNPWYGDPNQVVSCPAPAARCDQSVQPGRVIPAPSVNNGMNPLPAERLPGPVLPVSDPLTPPLAGTVQCNGQQPNPCTYTPTASLPINIAGAGTVVGPDGIRYRAENSAPPADDGWKSMLAPAG